MDFNAALNKIIKFAKLNDLNLLKDRAKTENKLYVYKETNTNGRIFFDYDDDTRIEISSDKPIYCCEDSCITLDVNNQYISNKNSGNVELKKNENLNIGKRTKGHFINIGECEILKAYIYVSDKGDKLWGETSSNDKIKFVTKKCSDKGDGDGHIKSNRK